MSSEAINYRQLQESFVSNHTGTTVLEVSQVISTTVLSAFLRSALLLLVESYTDSASWFSSPWKVYMLEFPCLILPTLLSATTFSDNLSNLQITMVFIAIGTILHGMYSLNEFRCSLLYARLKEFPSDEINTNKLDYISSFKAHTLIGTVISILAVDFTVYPRRYCKTEVYGTGLMDVGVGLFILSNAVVSPEARNMTISCKVGFHRVWKSVFSSWPLLLLGIVRTVVTKGIEYQEHVTEYGTHWNFFFTLAAVKIFSSITSYILPHRYWKFLAALFATVYQYCLTSRGLNQYIQQGFDGHGGRHGFIDSNREGILSNLGYFVLYLLGVEIGVMIFQKERHTILDNFTLFLQLSMYGIMAFTALPFVTHIEPVSRRFVNLPYIIWVIGVGLQQIASFLLVDLIFKFVDYLRSTKECKNNSSQVCYSLIESVNYNSLLYFLLANFLTGMVNLTLKTILVPPLQSMFIIIIYMFVLSSISFFLYVYKLKFKFW